MMCKKNVKSEAFARNGTSQLLCIEVAKISGTHYASPPLQCITVINKEN